MALVGGIKWHCLSDLRVALGPDGGTSDLGLGQERGNFNHSSSPGRTVGDAEGAVTAVGHSRGHSSLRVAWAKNPAGAAASTAGHSPAATRLWQLGR